MATSASSTAERTLRRAALLLGASAMLLGCTGVAGSGRIATEPRTIAAFDQLTVQGPFEVRLTVGGDAAMTLAGDDNLLPLVVSVQDGSSLTIRATETVRPSGALIVTLSTPSLHALNLTGAVKLEAGGLQTDKLALSASGAVDATLTGAATAFEVNASGAASIRARELKATTVTFDGSGAVSGQLFASAALKATISGAGTIDCWGKPRDVDKTVSGAGSINLRD